MNHSKHDKSIVIFTEEPSAKILIETLVERHFTDKLRTGIDFHCYNFEGKSHLKQQFPLKLRGWRKPNTYFLITCDQDSNDCLILKQKLQSLANSALPFSIVIFCQELESFYLGDLKALQAAFGLAKEPILANKYKKSIDEIRGAKEEVKKLIGKPYGQIEGARRMASVMNPNDNQSKSFQHFWQKLEAAFQ